MDYKQIFVVQLVFCLIGHGISEQGESICRKANAEFCGECIQAGPNCGWCTDRNFNRGGEPRCDDVAVLLRKGCPESKIENPTGSQELLENIMVTDTAGTFNGEHITQLQPQKLRLKLRPGVPMTFSVKYKRVQDHPVDLYYLMRLTSSTKQDFEKAKILASTLLQELKNLTSDFRIGFGSFVETTVKSSDSETPAKTESTCPDDQNCTSILRFKHMLHFTRNMMLFNNIVNKQRFSENLDARESGLDAMMQIAACHEQIGWRSHATRLLVFSTDSEFNFTRASNAGEIVLPNDGQCHLKKSTEHHHEPPSITQVVQTLNENNIQVIFAVPKELKSVYKELENMLSRSGVGTSSENSTDVIQQIVDTYTSLSSEVTLAHSKLPKGINISYKSYCKNGEQGMEENGRTCSNISIGDEVQFQISVTAHECLKTEQQETIKVKMLGSTEEIEVILRLICECECQHNRIRGGPPCIGSNTILECGVCRCEKGRFGKYCECSSGGMDFDYGGAGCVKPGGRSEVCSNHGFCMCGHCVCHQRENPNEEYSGAYCECDNFSCDEDNGKICGGHGVCDCGLCMCEPGYAGRACACPTATTSCLAANGQICNGQGSCSCGQCICDVPEVSGPTCELSVLSTESMQKCRGNEYGEVSV